MNQLAILLVGAGGHARACIDVIEKEGRYAIAGLVGTPDEVGGVVLGYPILGGDAELPALRERCPNALITLGQIQSPEPRIRLFALLERLGFTLPAVVSPRGHVSCHASLGPGSIVMHGAIVNACARVGCNCILNSRALVEHDAVIEDHCHISTGVLVNGGARVGAGSFVGSGSVLREGVALGERCLVGMGLAVRKNYPAQSRIIR
ncbi:MAG: putative acetyltransferase EpsM [Candidatus Accumulibacter phosphatis]|uniref:Putative acetyltransferase EpsM n=1 Tax=Candidatus Accumulibacter phosphatis TaxID=327160 RepID=A0A080LRM1_9PROT|nr:MAG: putative acetyltransferase EpsM [Candidatus Accumulibacter phosphatis]